MTSTWACNKATDFFYGRALASQEQSVQRALSCGMSACALHRWCCTELCASSLAVHGIPLPSLGILVWAVVGVAWQVFVCRSTGWAWSGPKAAALCLSAVHPF